MTRGRHARRAWCERQPRMRGRRAIGSLVRVALVGLLALSASGQEATDEPATSPDPAVAMWLEIRDTDDRDLLAAFVEAFPDSPYVHAARARLKRLEEPQADAGPERTTVRKRRRSR